MWQKKKSVKYMIFLFKKSMGHDNFKSSGTAHLYLINAFL